MRKMWGSTIYYHSEARNAIARGVNAVAELVQATMGPMGKNIIIERAMRYPFVTKDGVTVANHIKPKEPREAIGADLCRNAAQKTDEVAGDGTTTAIVLTQELIEQGIRLIEAGFNPVKLKQGMDLALQTACRSLEALSIPADSYEKIFYAAAISAKEQEIGQLIADAMEQVGKDGIIMIREGLEQKTSVEVNLGLELEKGYLTPNFITKGERLQLEMDHVAIYMTDAILKDAAEAEKLLRWCKDEQTNLLVIAKDVVKDALGVLVETNRVGKVAVAAVEAPGYAESRVLWLDDIAAACGGTPVSSIVGTNLANAKKSVLGHADHVKVTRTRTMISGGDGDKTAVEARVRQLKAMLAQETEEEEQKKLEQRIARLTGGVATIRVGGATKAAMQERKYRIEDAVHAAQAAAKYGILPGGGTALIRAAAEIGKLSADEEIQAGVDLLAAAMERPFCQMVKNARGDVARALKMVKHAQGWNGYDIIGNQIVPLLEAKIVDPTFVTMTALRNAESIASTVLTMETLVEGFQAVPFDESKLTPELMRRLLT